MLALESTTRISNFQYQNTTASVKMSNEGSTSRNAARERSRVRSLRAAFHSLQMSLPSVPPNTKLSKLDVLVLATNYISHLTRILQDQDELVLEQNYDNAETQPVNGTTNHEKIEKVFRLNGNKASSKKNRNNYLHPVKKWPIRSRLYAGIESGLTVSKNI